MLNKLMLLGSVLILSSMLAGFFSIWVGAIVLNLTQDGSYAAYWVLGTQTIIVFAGGIFVGMRLKARQ